MSHWAGVLGTASTSSADWVSIATYRRKRASTDSVGDRNATACVIGFPLRQRSSEHDSAGDGGSDASGDGLEGGVSPGIGSLASYGPSSRTRP